MTWTAGSAARGKARRSKITCCRWPDLTAGDNQRLQKAEAYDAQFKDEEDVLDYAPKSLADYERFNAGDSWILKVGKVRGRVESLQKETAEQE